MFQYKNSVKNYSKAMLRKDNNFMIGMNQVKKGKFNTESTAIPYEANKENHSFKSVADLDDKNIVHFRSNLTDQPVSNSQMVSPTFQNGNKLSLKNQLLYKQPYKEYTVSLSHQFDKPTQQFDQTRNVQETNYINNQQNLKIQIQLQQLKKSVIQHYQSKRYWKKIQKLFELEGVDAVIAWGDAVEKYQTVKEKANKYEQQISSLKEQIQIKDQQLVSLEKQSTLSKRQVPIKCKGCQNLQQKQKEYFTLYQQHKKLTKQLSETKDNLKTIVDQLKKSKQEYQVIMILKQQVEKKNKSLSEKQKQQTNQIQKLQNSFKNQIQALQSQHKNSTKLHVQYEQLKEKAFKNQNNYIKMEEKYKRQISELKNQLQESQHNKRIFQSEMEKLKNQLSTLKPNILKMQIELNSAESSIKLKSTECEELKRKHLENMAEERKRSNQLESLLQNKQEELNKAYRLVDQSQNIKVKLQLQLNQQKIINNQKEEEISKNIQIIKDLENRFKDSEQSQHRIKDYNQFYNLGRTKNTNVLSNINQNSSPINNAGLSKKIMSKIKQICQSLKQINEQNVDSYQRRRFRDDDSEEREILNAVLTEKYVDEINSELSSLFNKYNYVHKQNQILKQQIENQIRYKQQQKSIIKRQVDLKEKSLQCIVSFVPEQYKNAVLDLLFIAEKLSKDEHHEEVEFQQFDELRYSLESQSKEWKDNYQRIQYKIKKMEEEIRRLQDQNQQIKRKIKGKDSKKPYQEIDSREIMSKKDIRKKYNFDN